MRSIHKGTVSFGLVSVPVKLYGATEEHDAVSHQVHNKDGGRIRYKRTCEDCGEVVEYKDIAKQYEHGDQAVILTDDDLATLPAEQDRTIEVLEFVPTGSLDEMLPEKPYYLSPEKGADKAYALLAATLDRIDRTALVRFAMRGKTRLAALRTLHKEQVLVLHTLRWPDEIRRHDWITVKDVEIKPAELNMADRLVGSMSNEFNPDRYRDTYQEELQALITAKAEGGELPVVEKEEEPEDVSDLLAALEASIAKKGKKNG